MTDVSAPDLSLQADAAPDVSGGPSYYRLDDAAWAAIGEQYRAGATAKTLSALWRVSPGTIYRRACAGGWTKAKRSAQVSQVMVARERERLAFAEQIAGEADAAKAPREADALQAARTLMRRGAGSALKGRSEQARAELGLAQDLLRAARLLAETEGTVAGVRASLVQEARQALAADPDWTEPGWRDSAEAKALDATILAGMAHRAKVRGRTPPDRLPPFCWLPAYPQYRPLAEALEVIDADDNAVCEDFEAAVEACQQAGRGAVLEAALTTPLPLEHCCWLSPEQKAEIAAEEEAAAADALAAAGGAEAEVSPGEAGEGAPAVEEPPPAPLRLGEPEAPWAKIAPPQRGLAPRRLYVGGP